MSYLKVFYYILLSWYYYCIGHVASVVTEVTDRFGYHEACCVWYRIYQTAMMRSVDIQDAYSTPDTVRYFPWSPTSIK